MKPPSTYSEWVDTLEKLEEGLNDQEVAASIKSGSLEWQAGVADRFIRVFVETMDSRMNRAIDKFNKVSQTGDTNSMIRGIGSLRSEFTFLAGLTDLPFVPEEYRKQLRANVVNASKQVQSSLESSAKTDRTGRLQTIVKNNRLSIE